MPLEIVRIQPEGLVVRITMPAALFRRIGIIALFRRRRFNEVAVEMLTLAADMLS